MLDPMLADVFNRTADIVALATFFGMLTFSVLYSIFYQWGKRKAGKSVLFLATAFNAVSLVSVLALWLGPDYWLRPFWRLLAWAYALYAVGYLIYALLYNWKDRHPIRVDARTSPIRRGD